MAIESYEVIKVDPFYIRVIDAIAGRPHNQVPAMEQPLVSKLLQREKPVRFLVPEVQIPPVYTVI